MTTILIIGLTTVLIGILCLLSDKFTVNFVYYIYIVVLSIVISPFLLMDKLKKLFK